MFSATSFLFRNSQSILKENLRVKSTAFVLSQVVKKLLSDLCEKYYLPE